MNSTSTDSGQSVWGTLFMLDFSRRNDDVIELKNDGQFTVEKNSNGKPISVTVYTKRRVYYKKFRFSLNPKMWPKNIIGRLKELSLEETT